MKVLHIGEYVNGGIATYLKEVLAFQAESEKISEVYLLMSNTTAEMLEVKNINIILYNFKRNIFSIIPAILQINKYIKNINPDIIHIHSTYAGVLVRLIFLFQSKRTKIVYCSHGWSFLMQIPSLKKKIYISIEKILSYRTDLIINISQNELIQSIEYGMPKKKSILIYNGISDVLVNFDNEFKFPFELDENKVIMLFVGRFDHQKGLDILLDAYKKNIYKYVQLILIGNNVLNKKNIQIPDDVINVGWIRQDQIDSYYQLCDVVIMPSRWEGFGLVAIEAMRNKKPVIASNCGALSEIITNCVNGYIFDLDDIKSLEDILISTNKEVLKLMGERGYKVYKQKFDSRLMNDRIIQEYIKLF